MFPFVNKRKEHQSDPIRAGQETPISNKPIVGKHHQISQEEAKPLEDAKHRLLGAFGGKKRDKSPSPQLSTAASKGHQRTVASSRPVPPAKPPRITPVPSEDCDIFHPLKTFNIPGLELPVLKTAGEERTLTFNRQQSGEYGFCLRRAVAIDRFSDGAVSQRTVILVDYTKQQSPMNNGLSSLAALQHGDQLLAINGEPVEDLPREEIVGVIRKVEGDEIRLKVKQLNSNNHRTVIFNRQPNGEFGFLLRRSQVVDVYSDGTEQRRAIVLAEPMQQPLKPGFDINADGDAERTDSDSLLRDQLVAINGRTVDSLTRDELINFINNHGGDAIQLTVRPARSLSSTPEGRTVTSVMANGEDITCGAYEADSLPIGQQSTAVSNFGDRRNEGEGVLENERVWLVHRYGYAAGIVSGGINAKRDGGKIRLRLTEVPGDVVIEVDAIDIEKANANSLDRADDLAKLVYLNESSAIHLLRNRYAANLIHTYAGSFATLVLKPQIPPAIYSDQVMQGIKGCRRRDMPPHIYAVSQQTYRSMVAGRRSQAVIFTGRSGSGKTTQLRHFLHYLCRSAGTVNKLLHADKATAMFNILDAFGSCWTSTNNNASRFVTFLTLDFDHVGEISSGLLQCLILEYNRVVRSAANSKDGNFHVFSHLWHGATPDLRKELLLDALDDPSCLLRHRDKTGNEEFHRNRFARLSASFETVGVSATEQRVIFAVLAAIFHLAAAGATKGIPSFKSTFLKPVHAQKAAQLLGVSLEELQKTIFMSTVQQQEHQEQTAQQHQQEKRSSISGQSASASGGLANRLAMGRNFRRVTPFKASGLLNEKLSITDRPGDGMEALEAFIIGLYRETFSLIVSLINRSLASNYRTVTSITLIDYPGYQSGADKKAGFNELCFNYVNERVHAFYHDTVFQNQMELYRQEKVNVDFQLPAVSPAALVDLIDKPLHHHVVKSTNLEARSQEKRGLLWLLDEESIFPGARDDSFVERVFVHYAEATYSKYLMKSRAQHNHFVIRHAFGTFPVVYNATGWLRLAQENPVTRQALPLLQESSKSDVSSLFLTLRSGGILGGQGAGISSTDNASLRRTTAVYKTLAAPQAIKRKSYCALLKLQMDYLIENLRRCGRVYFVHCLDPFDPASDVSQRMALGNFDEKGMKDLAMINVPSLRSQLRALQIADAVRFDKIGYNERLLFGEFRRRYDCLSSRSGGNQSDSKLSRLLDDREAVSRLLTETFEADASQATLGVGCVFMKANFLAQLEDKRDQELTDVVVQFQAQCRAYLAKQHLKKRRIQDTAIRCVQKNINKYLAVRAWPWWRLYTRVLPLLSVQKTEEEIKAQQEELEAMKAKCKKLEKQYSELRLHCDRLEARLDASRSEASDERVTASQLTEALEEENNMRLRTEKELAELKSVYATVEKQLQRSELEAMEYKTAKLSIPAAELDNGAVPSDQLKEQLQEARMQLEMERKRYENEKKEELEHHRHMKQKMEKKIADLQKEVENAQDQASSARRLAEKSRDEEHDLRLHVQQLTARNAELEKRQRKFDSELQAVKAETDVERAQKERLLKEYQAAMSECLRVEGELRKARDEVSEWQQKHELAADNVRVFSESHGQVNRENDQQMRLQKQALERKCADQEAELDDLSGELQLLQQRVTRLEMQNEKLRQENAKDSERREEEFDELRAHNQRRIRMSEEQIEEERHHRETAQRKVKELEIRLREAEQAPASAGRNDAENASLRRHLKEVKALLKDSQAVLEQYERNSTHKTLMKQLKNQLEDANAAKLSAVKSKQNLESELEEVRAALSASEAARSAAEDRCIHLVKERTTLENRLTDLNQEIQDLLKKYKAQVQQSSVDHITLSDQIQRNGDLERENDSLKDQVNELSSQLERKNASSVDKHKLQLAETKLRQLESKLELESASRVRAEAHYAKAQEQLDNLKDQVQKLEAAKEKEVEAMKRLQTQYAHQQDTLRTAQRREADSVQKQRDLEAALERLEEENIQTTNELKVALRRAEDLQAALRDDVDAETYNDADDDADLDAYYSSENDDIAVDGNGNAGGKTFTVALSRPSSGASTHISC